MRRATGTLAIILAVFAIVGVLAACGLAKKPAPASTEVSVTGAIQGQGDPAQMRVTFCDSSLLAYGYPEGSTQDPVFISNPDYPPSLTVTGPGRNMKTLRYYYCAHASHVDTSDLICNDSGHNDYYYCLQIGGGTVQKKSATGRIIFPADSTWRISSKATMSVVAQGTLSEQAVYDVLP